MLVAQHVAENNRNAAMPGASAGLRADVQEMLRSDAKYNVLANMRSLLLGGEATWVGGGPKSADDRNFAGPAVDTIHTDFTEKHAMSIVSQLTGATEGKRSLK